MNHALQGLIVFYLANKGYGYVRVPETREEFHFRTKNLRTPVKAGDWVSFVLKQNQQGCFADEIEYIGIG